MENVLDRLGGNILFYVSLPDIVMPYNILWLFTNGFHKAPNPDLLLKIVHFSSQLVLGIYVGNYVLTWNIRRKREQNKYVQEKRYCKLLVFLSTLFV